MLDYSSKSTWTSTNIKFLSPEVAEVKSGTTSEIYLVNLRHKRCTCMDWTMNIARDKSSKQPCETSWYYECKHIKYAEEMWSILTNFNFI